MDIGILDVMHPYIVPAFLAGVVTLGFIYAKTTGPGWRSYIVNGWLITWIVILLLSYAGAMYFHFQARVAEGFYQELTKIEREAELFGMPLRPDARSLLENARGASSSGRTTGSLRFLAEDVTLRRELVSRLEPYEVTEYESALENCLPDSIYGSIQPLFDFYPVSRRALRQEVSQALDSMVGRQTLDEGCSFLLTLTR